MTLLILGLVIFLGIHGFSMARAARQGVIDQIGPLGFRGLYSVVSFIGFGLIVYGYGEYRAAGAILVWSPPRGMSHLAAALMLPVFVLFVASNVYAKGGWIKARVKHPLFLAIKLWATAHLLANGDLGSMLLFGGFLGWAVIARIAVKRRELVEGAPDRSAGFGLMDAVALGAGLALYVVFALWLHPWLIGVPVFG
jgi:uncharacterized membrane protein